MMEKILYDTEKFDVVTIEDSDDKKVGIKYKDTHVLILPYILSANQQINKLGVLDEPNLFREDGHAYTVISGTIEDDESNLEGAKRELNEESGYNVPDSSKWTYLGELTASKMVDSYYPCFVVDVTDITQTKKKTDGSKNEKATKFVRLDVYDFLKLEDSLLLAIFLKFYVKKFSKVFKK